MINAIMKSFSSDLVIADNNYGWLTFLVSCQTGAHESYFSAADESGQNQI